jgi:hypothetical protein
LPSQSPQLWLANQQPPPSCIRTGKQGSGAALREIHTHCTSKLSYSQARSFAFSPVTQSCTAKHALINLTFTFSFYFCAQAYFLYTNLLLRVSPVAFFRSDKKTEVVRIFCFANYQKIDCVRQNYMQAFHESKIRF